MCVSSVVTGRGSQSTLASASDPGLLDMSSNLSRASSTGSLTPAGPSTQPASDDEQDGGSLAASSASGASQSYKERRREAHTAAEQKRRDAIKKGYDYLQELVPICHQDSASQKMSKALVLQKSIEYIQQVQEEKQQKETELNQLRKEVIALQIMKNNYEQLVKAHQAQPANYETHVPSEVKFQTFKTLMDHLFESFNQNVSMKDFGELSGCVFSWLEEHCKPQLLQGIMYHTLEEIRASQDDKREAATAPMESAARLERDGL